MKGGKRSKMTDRPRKHLVPTEAARVNDLIDGRRTTQEIVALLPELDPQAVAYYCGECKGTPKRFLWNSG